MYTRCCVPLPPDPIGGLAEMVFHKPPRFPMNLLSKPAAVGVGPKSVIGVTAFLSAFSIPTPQQERSPRFPPVTKVAVVEVVVGGDGEPDPLPGHRRAGEWDPAGAIGNPYEMRAS
eukprot:COSAG02_NODE_8874_length_2410_cov_2.165082_1_plen_116_part_00